MAELLGRYLPLGSHHKGHHRISRLTRGSESLSHAGENLLGMLRDNKLIANAETISALLLLLDGLRAILASVETDGSEGENKELD